MYCIFLPLMTLVNESQKEFYFGVLEDFGISRGIQILPRGNFFQISPKAFPQSVRLWFSRGARISPKGPLWKNLGKPAVRSVHSKSQIALIENQSLVQSVEKTRVQCGETVP